MKAETMGTVVALAIASVIGIGVMTAGAQDQKLR